MSEVKLSSFVQDAECSRYDNPDLWQPERNPDEIDKDYAQTTQSKLARSICADCLVKQECLSYSLQYEELEGIWAGLDYYERKSLRRKLGIRRTLSLAPDSSLLRVIRYIYAEGDN